MREKIPDLSRREWERLIDDWIFSQRDRAILKRRLFDGIVYEVLAEEFGLSVRQTKTIVYKCTDRLIRRLDRLAKM